MPLTMTRLQRAITEQPPYIRDLFKIYTNYVDWDTLTFEELVFQLTEKASCRGWLPLEVHTTDILELVGFGSYADDKDHPLEKWWQQMCSYVYHSPRFTLSKLPTPHDHYTKMDGSLEQWIYLMSLIANYLPAYATI